MSINDPQWGNSHRPEQKEPEQVPELTGTESVQPKDGDSNAPQQKTVDPLPPPPPKSSPPEGPPDLEELWQRLVYQTRCKLARALGKEPPQPPEFSVTPVVATREPAALNSLQALSLKSWLIGVSLIVGAWLVSGFYLVDVQQRGILSRFGYIISIEEAGWHWRWPYPIDAVRLVNVTAERTLEVGLATQKGNRLSPGLMLTSDGNLVGVSYAVVYQVTDPVAYLAQADAPVDLLALLAETAVRDAVGGQSLSTMLAAGATSTASISKPMLQAARDRLQQSLEDFQVGMVVKSLELREVQLPAPVLQAAKEVERQEQASAKGLRDAQSTATENLIKAHKLAAKLQDESTAYALALENAVRALRDTDSGLDKAQTQQALESQALVWRQQYPLVFAGPAELKERIQPKATARSTGSVGSENAETKPTSAVSDPWRNRDLMRSRDRVDRPGSGS